MSSIQESRQNPHLIDIIYFASTNRCVSGTVCWTPTWRWCWTTAPTSGSWTCQVRRWTISADIWLQEYKSIDKIITNILPSSDCAQLSPASLSLVQEKCVYLESLSTSRSVYLYSLRNTFSLYSVVRGTSNSLNAYCDYKLIHRKEQRQRNIHFSGATASPPPPTSCLLTGD